MSDSVKQFILQLVEKKSRLPKVEDIDGYNFIDSGHVDSLAIMKFIVEIESHFDIELLDSDIESDCFRTIGGLVSIIDEKLRAGKS